MSFEYMLLPGFGVSGGVENSTWYKAKKNSKPLVLCV